MRTFLDNNILVYLIGSEDNPKKQIVKTIINPDQFISTQVIAENVNVCLKKFRLDKQMAFDHGKNLLQKFTVLTVEKSTIEKSFIISGTYTLAFGIVSSWQPLYRHIAPSYIQKICKMVLLSRKV